MKKIPSTYRFIASLLCATIISSFAFPVFGMAAMIEHCMKMEKMDSEMHSDMDIHYHSESMTEVIPMHDSMNHSDMMDCCPDMSSASSLPLALDHCQTSIDCDCNTTYDGVEHNALISQNLKIPLVKLTFVLLPSVNFTTKIIPPPLWLSNSYSPPLLFLANESFLI